MGKRRLIWHVMVGMTSDHACCERESDTSIPVTSGGNLAHAAGVSFNWMMRALKRRALFAVISPELLIWNLGTASAWNKYLRSL